MLRREEQSAKALFPIDRIEDGKITEVKLTQPLQHSSGMLATPSLTLSSVIVLLPCKHLCLCSTCKCYSKDSTLECPICVGEVESMMDIFPIF